MTRLNPGPIVLALLVGALPILPVEHLHESDVDGHHEVIVHRHAQAHHHGDDADHLDQQGRAVDHDDDHTIALNSTFITPAPHRSIAPVAVLIALLAPPPLAVAPGPTVDYVERLIHGPPRAPSGLRAPPVPARL